MTNRDMVKPAPSDGSAQKPNRQPLPPMPADEDSRSPVTDREPVDSPQPNASEKRGPPRPGEIGLATRR